jgi:hypothetical protein
MQSMALTAQSSNACHGALCASIEVVCQALADSRHLAVHLELGAKLTADPTWMDMAMLLLRALEASPSLQLSVAEVGEVRCAALAGLCAHCT